MADDQRQADLTVAATPSIGLPQWLESTLNITPGRDPLGFQTITVDRIVPRLVPGILALSRRARYFSFFAFLLDEYQSRRLAPSNNGLSPFIKSREYDLAIAVELCPRRHRDEVTASNARQRAAPAAASNAQAFARRESVESYLGGYGLYYRTPMIDLGLVAPRGTSLGESRTPTPLDVLNPLTDRGARLATAFRNRVSDTEYFQQYFIGDQDIPRSVLVEYASAACLCRLDEAPEEQLVLRETLLEQTPSETSRDVARRREAFAFILWLAAQNNQAARLDSHFRDQTWTSHEDPIAGRSPSLADANARWAALIAKELTQEGFSNIWASVCRRGLQSGHEGIPARQLDELLAHPLVDEENLQPFDISLSVDPSMLTGHLRDRIAQATDGHSLEQLRAWAVRQNSAMAGLALILAVGHRVALLGDQTPAWHEIAVQHGERQPGLAGVHARLAEHLRLAPTLRETMSWLVRTFIVWPHEAIAYSKLPESTFRFRWESGRLHFFDLRPERFALTDIRRDALSWLAIDIGLLDASPPDRAVPTSAGDALVTEVFA